MRRRNITEPTADWYLLQYDFPIPKSMTFLPFSRRELAFANREGERSFDFCLARSRPSTGTSALVRARNEATKIAHCLRSILPHFDEIVVVDNGSDDATAAIVREVMDRADPDRRIRLYSYPFRLARFGPEHDATDPDSVHSAVYYSNWALSHVTRRYVCKWDGDMVLIREVKERFGAFLESIQSGRPKRWTLAGQTIYRGLDGTFYRARGEVNREVEVFPFSHRMRFRKLRHWESLGRPMSIPKDHFVPVAFYELKFLGEQEFDHWSTREWPSERKRREWSNFEAIRSGQVDPDRFERLPSTFLDDQLP